MGEISRGADLTEAGTDVVDARHHCGEGRGKILPVHGNTQDGAEE